jgi:hypothetical protein
MIPLPTKRNVKGLWPFFYGEDYTGQFNLL